MKKLISVILVLAMFLSIPAQAGTISKAISTVTNKIEYITAGELVTSLMIGAKVKPDKPLDYWGKAKAMGLLTSEMQANKGLTKAQASYIVWQLINKVGTLKDKNIPERIEVQSVWDRYIRGQDKLVDEGVNRNYLGYLFNFVVITKYYKDGTKRTIHVWDKINGFDSEQKAGDIIRGIVAKWKKDNPEKIKINLRYTGQLDRDMFRRYISYGSSKLYFSGIPTGLQTGTIKYNTFYFDKQYPYGYAVVDDNVTVGLFEIKPFKPWAYNSFMGNPLYPEELINPAEDPRWNKELEDYIMSLPRKYPLDHTRFAYMAVDYNTIPQAYREPMLRLADMGIITPEMSDYYVGKIAFKPATMLTRADATVLITRVFDKSKRVVYDEVGYKVRKYWNSKENNAYLVGDKGETELRGSALGEKLLFGNPNIVLRMDELKNLAVMKYAQNEYKVLVGKDERGNNFLTYDWYFTIYYYFIKIIPNDDLTGNGTYVRGIDYSVIKNCNPQNYIIPPSYRKQFVYDMLYWHKNNAKYGSEKTISIQYGDVYVWFDKYMDGFEYTISNPSVKGYEKPIFKAQANQNPTKPTKVTK